MPSAKRNERAKNKDWNDRKRARELDRAANAGVGGPGEEIALPTTGITGQQASVPNLPSGIQKAVVPNPPSRIQKAVVPNFTFITQAPERAPVRLVYSMALRRDGPSRNNFWTAAKLDRLSEDKDSLISLLDEHGIASKDRICKKCGKDDMRFEERANGNVRYLCGKRILPGGEKCSGKQGFHVDTFMTQTKLPSVVILKYILLWTKGFEQQKIAEEVGISTHSAAPWNHYCRKAAYWAVQKRATPTGNGDVVEIDESQFGKWKYNRGHRVDGSWVFGGISRNSGDVFMVQVEKRDKTTLLPLIRQWILPQTTIICDGWRAYNTLEEEDYEVLQSYCIVCE